MKRFDLAVVTGDGKPGSDTEHLVRLRVYQDGKKLGSTRIPGGDFETAVGIMEGFKAIADSGVDLSAILPDVEME